MCSGLLHRIECRCIGRRERQLKIEAGTCIGSGDRPNAPTVPLDHTLDDCKADARALKFARRMQAFVERAIGSREGRT